MARSNGLFSPPPAYTIDVEGHGRTRLELLGLDNAYELPSFAPDGKRYVFSGELGQVSGLFTATVGSDPHLLVNVNAVMLGTVQAEQLFSPTWSPDGRWVAFGAFSYAAGPGEVYVVGTDGTGIRRITSNSFAEVELAWAPDSRELAFVAAVTSTTGHNEAYVVNLESSRQEKLELEGFYFSNPSWSPDGASILFGCSGDICLLSRESGSLIELTTDGTNKEPVWSPTGDQIAFISSLNAQRCPYLDGGSLPCTESVYVMNVDGNNRTELISSDESIYDLIWLVSQ